MRTTTPRFVPAILLAAASASGCQAAGAGGLDVPPEDVARYEDSPYPPIDPEAKDFKAGPILATPDAAERLSLFDYHSKVVRLHQFGYVIRDNPAMHRTQAELTGLVIPPDSGNDKPTITTKDKKLGLPAKWDSRARGAGLPPIRNQGSCGSCWAFGTTAAVEASIAVSDGRIVDLSEQLVLDCSGQGTCGGGFWAYDLYKSAGGVLEKDYPYTAYDGACKSKGKEHPYTIESYHGVGDNDREGLKAAIMQYGAVGVTMAVCGSFPGYGGGVYDSTECNWTGSNHIVALVGWDDEIAHHQGKGAWIMRNSWGEDWGDRGYATMAYGVAGIEENGTYAVYKPEDPTDTDGDGVRDVHDNCKDAANTDQADLDEDGKGDACDGAFDAFERSLSMIDDDSKKVDLGFTFPFYGTGYASVNVNSDGNLTFGAGDDKTVDRSTSRFLTTGPRIAALYADLNPGAGGKVTYGKAAPDSLFVRWSAVPSYAGGATGTVTATLDATGRVTLAYGQVAGSGYLVGVSRGGQGNAAGESDLSKAGGAIGFEGAGAFYEAFVGGKAFDLSGATIAFAPGAGPGPDPTPVESTIALADDDSKKIPLGFSFPFFAASYADVYVNADGNLTFGKGDASTEYRTAKRFLTGAPRVAVLYSDLDPSKGGVVSYRHDDPESLTIRYQAVPAYGTKVGSTAVVKLESSGRITISYEGVGGSSYVVGVSAGGANNTAGESDLSGAGPSIGYGGLSAVYESFAAGKSFDLSGKTLVFGTEVPDEPAPAPAPAPAPETPIQLSDDGAQAVNLGFGFPFYGATYSKVWVNADGNVTFGKGDGVTANRTVGRFLQGAPRIAVLYSDLDPSAGGKVSYRHDDPQSITVRYAGIPMWGSAVGNTASLTLRSSGAITVEVDSVSDGSYIVGVSRGGAGNSAAPDDLSVTAGQPVGYSGYGAVYEAFDGGFDLTGQTIELVP